MQLDYIPYNITLNDTYTLAYVHLDNVKVDAICEFFTNLGWSDPYQMRKIQVTTNCTYDAYAQM